MTGAIELAEVWEARLRLLMTTGAEYGKPLNPQQAAITLQHEVYRERQKAGLIPPGQPTDERWLDAMLALAESLAGDQRPCARCGRRDLWRPTGRDVQTPIWLCIRCSPPWTAEYETASTP